MARILVIEDEPDLQDLLRYNLQKDGHLVTVAGTGNDGLYELRRQPFDLVLLDLMLPDRDGLEVCRIIRADEALQAVPIIMVTAKGEESDIVVGLGLGADDYITKPFRIKELLARVRVRVSRHLDAMRDAERKRIQVGDLVIDPVRHRVLIEGQVVPLTLTEFKLLHFLASHPGIAYGRYDLLDRIGDGESVVTDRTIDVHIRNLRKKLGKYDKLVETVRGVGYRFSEMA
ncbi:MAG: response regulator transcription factor [Planctomycetota bacterium]|nr:response regulator transcription factor [Planctomycetota bacterium]MCX8040513.1 response regulator transcription factor [Planctomycetota bacterium]MDW8373274.1 response regulator transcription factor [Planctomycetota bacterium]